MRTMIGFGLALATVLATAPAHGQDVTGKAKQFVGTYKLVSGKHGDQDVAKEHLDGVVKITDDTMTTYDREHKEVYVIRYAIEGAGGGQAQTLLMTVTQSSRKDAVGSKAWGLIKADGDKVMIIYDYKGKSYPTDFTPRNDGQNMFVLKRDSGK